MNAVIELPGGLFLPDDKVLLLARLVVPVIRHRWKLDGLPTPPQLDELFTTLEHRAARLRSVPPAARPAPPTSATFREVSPRASAGRWSGWLTTESAADQLGISDRAVRDLCERGRLAAVQPDGPRTAWLVDPDSLREHQQRRRRRDRAAQPAA